MGMSKRKRDDDNEIVLTCEESFDDVHIIDPDNNEILLTCEEFLDDVHIIDPHNNEILVQTGIHIIDPELCAEIYENLKKDEADKIPAADYMLKVQKYINPDMRAILIDSIVEVAHVYRLVPDTLYLTINYIDRFLSGNLMDSDRLQLLGLACLIIASTYEEEAMCAKKVREFCYAANHGYKKDDVLEMESAVLKYLDFRMSVPTVMCFLRIVVGVLNEAPIDLEHLASYLADVSLLGYQMLRYAPSVVAASAILLARYMQSPLEKPWDSRLRQYTQYKPSELRECVKALSDMVYHYPNSSLAAIRDKYSLHEYEYVATKYKCPISIPDGLFSEC